jgi:hypothetical protein
LLSDASQKIYVSAERLGQEKSTDPGGNGAGTKFVSISIVAEAYGLRNSGGDLHLRLRSGHGHAWLLAAAGKLGDGDSGRDDPKGCLE